MTLHDLLCSPTAALPKVGNEGDFSEYYKKFTDEYFRNLETVIPIREIDKALIDTKNVSLDIRDAIIETLKLYLSGRPSAAYLKLDDAVRTHKQIFENIVTKQGMEYFICNMFRIRTVSSEHLKSIDMFHVPFKSRRKVSSNRYSIPGFPSLYLSSSLYTAWKELSTPKLDTVVAVRVEFTKQVRVLDMGHPPHFLAATLAKLKPSGMLFDLLKAMFILWPLQAACSVAVYDCSSPFKPEYIVPQLVLQLLRDSAFGDDIQGIRYFSMNYGQSEYSFQLGSNYVFPVQNTNADGHCEVLKELMLLTQPLPWHVADLMTDDVDVSQVNNDFIELSPGYSVQYQLTKFARIESVLMNQKAVKL